MASPSSPGLFTQTCDRFLTRDQQATVGWFFNAVGEVADELRRTSGPFRDWTDCSCSKCAASAAAKEEYYRRNNNNNSEADDDESNYQVRGSDADDDGLYDRDFYDEDAGEACIRSTSSCWPEPLQPQKSPVPAAGEYADLAATSPYDAEFEKNLLEVEEALLKTAAKPTIAERRGKPCPKLELVPIPPAMISAYNEANSHAKPDASAAALPKSKHHRQAKAAEEELRHLPPKTPAKALEEHLRRMNQAKKHDGLDGESIARWVLMVDLPGEGDNDGEDYIKIEEEEDGYAYDYDFARYHDPSSPCVPAPLFSPAGGDNQRKE
ncbi:hypothetical protein PG995_007286 [Apiospora arundinis]